MTRYLLDTNVFLEARNRHYGFDFCPAFWDWLHAARRDDVVASVDAVSDELINLGDDLSQWVREQGPDFFLKPGNEDLVSIREVSRWANEADYERIAISEFLDKADFWLIAQARVLGSTVITHERPGNSRKKIKIPDACVGVGVRCANPFEMLRREQARFVFPGAEPAT